MNKKLLIILLLSLSVISCSDTEQKEKAGEDSVSQSKILTVPQSQSDFDAAKVTRGGKLYQQNCASCHGENGEGDPNWRKRKVNGKLPPPPLNGTGHTWHHSKALLMTIITNGTIDQGGEMPAWGGKLSQKDIDAILTWVQSTWTVEIYKHWLEINER